MKKDYIVKQITDSVWCYTFKETNQRGETLTIELSKCEDWKESKNSLPKLWKKAGYIDRVLDTYWNVKTYVTDTEGNSYGRYNPQVKTENGRSIINFDWMFEATKENEEKLINQVYKLFSESKGETATEEKNRKIKEFANKYNVNIYNVMPKGWKVLKGALTAPLGTVWISNKKSLKSGELKSGLLVCK